MLVWCLASHVLYHYSVEARNDGEDSVPKTTEGCVQQCNNGASDINCAESNLQEIPINRYCQSALTIDLSYNEITELHRDDFTGFAVLKTLLLSYNQIQDIPTGVFRDLGQLNSLYIQTNNLSSLQPGVFQGLEGLSGRLMLRCNHLTRITTGVFESLASVQLLSVDSNRIETIQANSFDGMAELTYLYLMNNRITMVVRGTFSGLDKLERVQLNNNQIEILEVGAFDGLDKLRELRLGSNRITMVSSIVGLPNLSFLNIADNRISSLDNSPFLLGKLQDNFSIAVQGNPLSCTCSVETLRLWYRRHKESVDEATCVAPEQYSNMRLVEISKPLPCTTGLATITTNGNDNETGNPDGSIGGDPNSLAYVVTIILLAGLALLVVVVCIVMRRHRRRKRAMCKQHDHYMTPSCPTHNRQPNIGFQVEGYSTYVNEDDGTDKVFEELPPKINGHVFHQTEHDETSEFLPPVTSGYLSLEEINSSSELEEHNRLQQKKSNGALPHTSTPISKPSTRPSISPEAICTIDFTQIPGQAVISPVGDSINEDDEMFDMCSDENPMYAKPFTRGSSKPTSTNNSTIYITPPPVR